MILSFGVLSRTAGVYDAPYLLAGCACPLRYTPQVSWPPQQRRVAILGRFSKLQFRYNETLDKPAAAVNEGEKIEGRLH